VSTDRLTAFRDFLAERVRAIAGGDGLVPELALDGALMPAAVSADFLAVLKRLAPFGAGNAEPRFAFPSLIVHRAGVVGETHVRAILGETLGPHRLKAIAFRAVEGELGRALLTGQGRGFHIAGRLREDSWQGRVEARLQIDDLAVA